MKYDATRGYWERHAPGAILDYGFDWAEWLKDSEGDTISDSQWACQTLTLSQATIAGAKTVVMVSGGVAGNSYKLTNTITTAAGRKDSRTILLVCEQI